MDIDNKFSSSAYKNKDHFVEYEGQIFAGHHYLVDVWGKGTYLNNEEEILNLITEAAVEAGASVLGTYSHKYEGEQGISAVVVLAESHISVHTWPERNFAAFDIFLCGATNPEKSLSVIKKYNKLNKVKVFKYKRGMNENK